MQLTERVQKWRAQGVGESFRGRRIHVFARDGGGPALLLLHGFPSSSYDWRALLDEVGDRAALAFDFLGFGLSEKPRDHLYSLAWQADLTEELVRRRLAGRPVFLVAHDMGTSVATELLARDLEGRLEWSSPACCCSTAASSSIAPASPRPAPAAQPARPARRPAEQRAILSRRFGRIFSAAHPLSDEEATDQWSLLCHDGGRSLGTS